MPPEKADEQNDTTRTEFATAMARIHFLVLAQVYAKSVNVVQENRYTNAYHGVPGVVLYPLDNIWIILCPLAFIIVLHNLFRNHALVHDHLPVRNTLPSRLDIMASTPNLRLFLHFVSRDRIVSIELKCVDRRNLCQGYGGDKAAQELKVYITEATKGARNSTTIQEDGTHAAYKQAPHEKQSHAVQIDRPNISGASCAPKKPTLFFP
jgi:hypothetical protein